MNRVLTVRTWALLILAYCTAGWGQAPVFTTYGRCDFPSSPIPIPNSIGPVLREVDFLEEIGGPNATCLCFPSANNMDCAPGYNECQDPVASAHITDIRVRLMIDHTWVGELLAELVHVNSGTSTRLLARPGSLFGCGGDDIDASFDDIGLVPADRTCEASVPTISGTVSPDDRMLPYRNLQAVDSRWQLRVSDLVNSNFQGFVHTGSLLGWCVEIDVENSGDLVFPLYNTPAAPTEGGFGCSFQPQEFVLSTQRDVDWVRFESAGGTGGPFYGTHSVTLTVPPDSDVQPVLALYDASVVTDPLAEPLAMTGQCIDGATPPLQVSPSAREEYFYARVQNCPEGEPGAYVLEAQGVDVARLQGVCLAVGVGPLNPVLISGAISDVQSGQPIFGASIYSNTNQFTFSGPAGGYSFSSVVGDIQVFAYAEGYAPTSVDLGTLSEAASIDQDFALQRAPFNAVTPDSEILHADGFE